MRYSLFIILLIASLTRLIGIGYYPPSLYWEEVALGYDAYSMWKTGKDYHGNPWPIVAFTSFGDYKPSGYFYLAAPFVGIFGLNNWSVRLPSALAGIFTVYLVYLIAKELFKKAWSSQLAALSLSIMPWHLHFSRAAFEVTVATMWLCLGVLFLLKARRASSFMMQAAGFMVLAAYTYHGVRLLGPLITLGFLIWQKHLWKTKWLYLSGLLSIVMMLPILVNINNPVVSQRFHETSFLAESKAVITTNSLREQYGNSVLAKIIYHRYWFWGKEIIGSMMSHFSPAYLFIRGDGNARHQIMNTGLLSWWMVVPLVIGFIKGKGFRWVFMGWTLMATVPAALSLPSPHTLRFLPAAPAFALLIGYGLSLIPMRTFFVKALVGVIITISFAFYTYQYFAVYPIQASSDWQYGYKQAVDYLISHRHLDDTVLFTRTHGRPSMYVLYYSNYSPEKIQSIDKLLPKDQAELLAFDTWSFFSTPDKEYDWIVESRSVNLSNYSLVHQINSLNGEPVFYIYRKSS